MGFRMSLFAHHSEVDDWLWPNFSPAEIACRGTGELLVNVAALDTLQAARDALGAPMRLNSAYRSPVHNARVGGAPMSRHKFADAFDIALAGHDRDHLEAVCRDVGFTGFGYYRTFLHVDIWTPRTWGARWGS